VSLGNALRSCWPVHSAVGCAVTPKCRIRRRSWANTKNTYRTWKRRVGTVKKSTDTRLFMWFSKKVRHVCEGGFRVRTMYLLTLVSPISTPSLSNSPWILGAPHIGFSRLIWRIRWRTSLEIAGRPHWPPRTFQVQKRRKPFRCQTITVSGLTSRIAERQSSQTPHSHAQKNRSNVVNLGFSPSGAERWVGVGAQGFPTGGRLGFWRWMIGRRTAWTARRALRYGGDGKFASPIFSDPSRFARGTTWAKCADACCSRHLGSEDSWGKWFAIRLPESNRPQGGWILRALGKSSVLKTPDERDPHGHIVCWLAEVAGEKTISLSTGVDNTAKRARWTCDAVLGERSW